MPLILISKEISQKNSNFTCKLKKKKKTRTFLITFHPLFFFLYIYYLYRGPNHNLSPSAKRQNGELAARVLSQMREDSHRLTVDGEMTSYSAGFYLFIYFELIFFLIFLVKVQVPQNLNKWIELKFQESPERSCKLIIMALTLSTSICTSTSRAVHRLSPSQYLRLFPGHHRKPTNLLLPRHPPTRFTLAFSRRRNNNPATTSSSKKKKVRKWDSQVLIFVRNSS